VPFGGRAGMASSLGIGGACLDGYCSHRHPERRRASSMNKALVSEQKSITIIEEKGGKATE
jgi:hypothetical protein